VIIAVSTRPADDATARPGRAGRITTCRYLHRGAQGQCTAEAADPDGPILLCTHHLAAALRLITHHAGATQ